MKHTTDGYPNETENSEHNDEETMVQSKTVDISNPKKQVEQSPVCLMKVFPFTVKEGSAIWRVNCDKAVLCVRDRALG